MTLRPLSSNLDAKHELVNDAKALNNKLVNDAKPLDSKSLSK